MTLREFLKEHEAAKFEVYEYGRPLAMFNNEKIKDYENSIKAEAIEEFADYIDKHSHISSDGCDICLDDDITILAENFKEQK